MSLAIASDALHHANTLHRTNINENNTCDNRLKVIVAIAFNLGKIPLSDFLRRRALVATTATGMGIVGAVVGAIEELDDRQKPNYDIVTTMAKVVRNGIFVLGAGTSYLCLSSLYGEEAAAVNWSIESATNFALFSNSIFLAATAGEFLGHIATVGAIESLKITQTISDLIHNQ